MRQLLRSLMVASAGSMAPKRPPLWIDTDAGFDDLVAIGALAATEPRLAVVSTTSGACETPEAGAGRVAALLQACGRSDVVVVAGAAAPQVPVKAWLTDAQAMLLRWFDDRSLGAASGPFDSDVAGAVAAVAPVDLLCLGPLTNVAAVLASGRVQIESITAIGGDAPGREAEFNFACDPAAASAVVESCQNLVLVGLDACTDAFPEASELEGIIGSLCSADACAARYDPLAAFFHASTGSFEIREATYGVDAAGRVVEGRSSVLAATRLVDREAYLEWLRTAADALPG